MCKQTTTNPILGHALICMHLSGHSPRACFKAQGDCGAPSTCIQSLKASWERASMHKGQSLQGLLCHVAGSPSKPASEWARGAPSHASGHIEGCFPFLARQGST